VRPSGPSSDGTPPGAILSQGDWWGILHRLEEGLTPTSWVQIKGHPFTATGLDRDKILFEREVAVGDQGMPPWLDRFTTIVTVDTGNYSSMLTADFRRLVREGWIIRTDPPPGIG
jgi:hypothetical protein